MVRRVVLDDWIRKNHGKFNRISIADFEIESTSEEMDKLVGVIKDMIDKYNGFIGDRHKPIVSKTSGGYCG
jgi:hypothetical protein